MRHCACTSVASSRSHSRPQSLRSFWPVVGIESSGLVQHRKSAIHGLPVKSSKSDWLTMQNEYSAHAQKIGSGQSSRYQPQTRRIVGSGDENERSRSVKSDYVSRDVLRKWLLHQVYFAFLALFNRHFSFS